MQFRFFGAPIQLRVLYALISSLLWWAMVEGERFLINSLWGYVSDVTGAVYAALVLIPYLPGLNGNFKLRALALLLCGVLSYWSATNFFFWLGKFAPWGMPDLILATAGIVGAVI
ncbi:MAG: hypothetical protein OEW16_10790, partial [Gammaproteobacteria bacterium]|nr:hypothetical protein [Gammaproteobacteria bacterium]